MKRTVSIIGGGRVGRTLGKCLRGLGWQIGAVVTRSDATARAAVRAIGGGTGYSAIGREALDSSVIFLTTPDDLLAPTAAELARLESRSLPRKNRPAHQRRTRPQHTQTARPSRRRDRLSASHADFFRP
jgi:Trk K+ transport system NAD-binding subunit